MTKQKKIRVVMRTAVRGKKCVGYVFPDSGVFRKTISFRIHLYRNLSAICISEEVFKRFPHEFKEIVVKNSDTGFVYRVSRKKFEDKKLEVRIEDQQFALPLSFWEPCERDDLLGPER